MAKRRENDDEQCARNWLRQQGHIDIRRPCSDPPDFVVDGDCAVEVTRLNQRIVVGDGKRSVGEEEAREPLTGHIKRALDKLGPPGNKGRSWVVDCEYDFREPLPRPNTVTAQLSEALAPLLKPYDDRIVSAMDKTHRDYGKHAGGISHLRFPHLCLDCGICLELVEFSHDPATFLLQNVSDGKGIGIADELKKGIQNRIQDKSRKLRSHNKIGEYENWWLILVDHICHLPVQSLSEHGLSFIRDQNPGFWSRIVIIGYRVPSWHYDLIPR